MIYTSAQLFSFVGVFSVDSLYGYVYRYTYQQEAIMFSDAQLAALIMASPFLLLSFVWAAGDFIVNRRAR